MNEEKQFWEVDDIKDPMFREEMAWRIVLRDSDRHFKYTAIVFIVLLVVSFIVMYCF